MSEWERVGGEERLVIEVDQTGVGLYFCFGGNTTTLKIEVNGNEQLLALKRKLEALEELDA